MKSATLTGLCLRTRRCRNEASINRRARKSTVSDAVIKSLEERDGTGMKPKEAIERLETIFVYGVSNNLKDKEAKKFAIQAIEKQVAKKPNTNFYGDGSVETVCPECEANIEDLGDEYSGCPYCLQKIDWSK